MSYNYEKISGMTYSATLSERGHLMLGFKKHDTNRNVVVIYNDDVNNDYYDTPYSNGKVLKRDANIFINNSDVRKGRVRLTIKKQ
jgi:hypothetical protein